MDGNILVMTTAWREKAHSASWETNIGVWNIGMLLYFGVGITWNIGSSLGACLAVESMCLLGFVPYLLLLT